MGKTLNVRWHTIGSRSAKKIRMNYLANMLSIYSAASINIEGETAESVAGFSIGLYYPENDGRRQQAFHTWGGKAIQLRANLSKTCIGNYIYWKNAEIAANSEEHYKILEQALRAKFKQNKDALDALISTKGIEFANKEGNESKFKMPPEKFCEILTKLRDEFVKKASSDFL